MLSKKFSSKTLPFLLIALFVVLLLARYVFGWVQFYRMHDTQMEPSIPAGEMILSTNLHHAQRGDIVCYKVFIEEITNIQKSGIVTGIGRIAAMGGDELTLKNGRAWVNGQATEEGLPLRFLYSVSSECYQANRAFFSRLPAERLAQGSFYQGTTDSLRYYLDDSEVAALQGKVVRYEQRIPLGSDTYYPAMRQLFAPNPGWTLDNLGPLSIPPGMVFILGDNRNNSADSRYRGFIPESDVVGVLLGQ